MATFFFDTATLLFFGVVAFILGAIVGRALYALKKSRKTAIIVSVILTGTSVALFKVMFSSIGYYAFGSIEPLVEIGASSAIGMIFGFAGAFVSTGHLKK